MSDLFIKGEIAMVISGPWFQSQLDPSKVPYTVVDFPTVEGRYPAPFLSIEGLYLSARSRKPEAAARLMKYLAGPASARLRARRAGQVPIRGEVARELREECRTNPRCDFDRFFYGQFLEVAAKAVVMPATPEARVLWSPYTKGLTAIVRRGADIRKALAKVDWEISRYIGACAAKGGDR
jgi:maltose-binding protein MalE